MHSFSWPCSVIVNANVHISEVSDRRSNIQEPDDMCHANGVEHEYLPSYSFDFTLIEESF